MNYFLGIDIGTTHTKAVIITEDGQPFFESKKGYDLLRPVPGYEEQDPLIIMDAVAGVLLESLRAVPLNEKIAGISFSAAMHSILPVDKDGRPLYKAIIWADTRSANEAEEIHQSPDGAALYKNTGIPVHPMSPLCKIVWFRKHLPGVFAKTHRFLSIKEYVFYCLFGKYIVDHSIAAATGLFNIHTKKWDPLALQIAGIHEEKLSQPVDTIHTEYRFTPFYAELFNVHEEIAFVSGASDGCLANLGSGAVQHGETALTIGTSGAVRMTVHPKPGAGIDMSDNEQLFTYPLADDIYVRGGAINNGGIVLKWLSEMFLSQEETEKNNYELLLSIAEQAGPGADGLLFLPYLLGERSPVWDPDARGVLLGLSIKHRKEQVIRASLEGICFTLYQIIRKLENVYGPVKVIYVSGGFVRSPFWVQLIADITGKELRVTEMADASAMGAAYLAMYATGFLKELSAVKEFMKAGKIYEPVWSNHKQYSELFQLFNSLYPKLKDDFAALSRLRKN